MSILPIIAKEVIHIRRDIRTLYFVVIWPVILLLLFGYTVSFDVKNIRLVVIDLDHMPMSRELFHTLEASGSFDIEYRNSFSWEESHALLDQGHAQALVIIPEGFSTLIARSDTAEIQIIIDGSDSNTARIFLGYLLSASQHYFEHLVRTYTQSGGGMVSLIEPRVTFLYNPSLRSQNFIIPGLIAVILMIIGTLVTSSTIAREWDIGTMEQLFYTPIKAYELVLGKLIPYLVIGIIQTTLVLLTGIIVFSVPFRGSIILYYVASVLFLAGALGLGLFISIISKSQQVATMLAFLTSVLPAFLLSGFIFPISSMPLVLRILSYAVPAKYFLTIIRGIFLKGADVSVLWINFIALFVFACVFLIISIHRFTKRVA
jgi:ABC-2 type transport system permease protein